MSPIEHVHSDMLAVIREVERIREKVGAIYVTGGDIQTPEFIAASRSLNYCKMHMGDAIHDLGGSTVVEDVKRVEVTA